LPASRLAVVVWMLHGVLSCFANPPLGLPLSRFHSLDEIGGINGDFEIGFDPAGRLSVVQNGSFSVLNDRNWIYLTEFENSTEVLHAVLQISENEAYYGASGSWGRLVRTPEGTLEPQQMAPVDRPIWSKSTNYLILFQFGDYIGFANWNGLVLWNKIYDLYSYFEVIELADVFSLGDRLFVSSAVAELQEVDFSENRLQEIHPSELVKQHIYHHCPFDDTHLLCATRRDGISLFDGERLIPWQTEIDAISEQFITGICRLPEGNFAVSIDSIGIFILNAQGKILSAYTTPEFLNVQKLVSAEPGILWFSTDSGIQQVFYGSRVTIVDKRQGLHINWPQVVNWRGKTIIASNGRLYESREQDPTTTSHFELVQNQPPWGTWGITSIGDTLLTGNRTGIYRRTGEASFETVLSDFSADRLVAVEPDLCYAIGKDAITLLKKIGDTWQECAARIPGVGYPTVVHRAGSSVWIELGVHRVARISYKDGALHSLLIDKFPWKEPGWIHVGVVDQIAILSSPTEGRLFFDETLDDFTPAPDEWQFLNELPYLVGRMEKDAEGNVWVSHYQGISQLKKEGGTYVMDTSGFEFVRASYPIIRIVNGNEVWFNTGTNLFHVNPDSQALPFEVPNPVLISVIDQRSGHQIPFQPTEDNGEPLSLRYSQNNLSFLFFADTYAIRNPRYNITIEGPFLSWSMTEVDSNITLPNLGEGKYMLSCQLTDNQFPISEPVTLAFQIDPPWYRSLYAYISYLLATMALFYLVIRWLLYRTRRHNKLLTGLVNERTTELERTMEKLNLETRNAATLAERDRLAGEIHDSVQQGLTGLMIHLDGVLRSPLMCDELRSSLGTARKMVDYTRQEVQHALLDMESPFLQDSDIGKALKRIARIIPSSSTRISIKVEGNPFPIPSTQAHHLLRISQEAMTNAVRHGAAKHIELKLEYRADSLTLQISDNGCGFDPQTNIDHTLHFGLRGMRNRAKSIGCDLSVNSLPGTGTTVSIYLPRKQEIEPEPS